MDLRDWTQSMHSGLAWTGLEGQLCLPEGRKKTSVGLGMDRWMIENLEEREDVEGG